MQLSLPLEAGSLVERVHEALKDAYGPPRPPFLADPLAQLVLAMLGGQTKGEVSLRAFHALRRRYPTWEALRDAPGDEVFSLIRDVTHPEKKFASIPAALRQITRHAGRPDISFLSGWPDEAARAWLMRLPGVGPKASAAALNFSTLRRRTLVVDTHHLRVARRLGLVPEGMSLPAAYRRLERQVPDCWSAADVDDHHMLMKQHGQRTCRPAVPDCAACRLAPLCTSARAGRTEASRKRHALGRRTDRERSSG